jgi:hypothetical protein
MQELPGGMTQTELEAHLRALAGPGGLRPQAPPQPALRLTFHPSVAVAFGHDDLLPPGVGLPVSDLSIVRALMCQTTGPDGSDEVHYFWFDRGGFLNMLRNAIAVAHDADSLDEIVAAVDERRAALADDDGAVVALAAEPPPAAAE